MSEEPMSDAHSESSVTVTPEEDGPGIQEERKDEESAKEIEREEAETEHKDECKLSKSDCFFAFGPKITLFLRCAGSWQVYGHQYASDKYCTHTIPAPSTCTGSI